MIELGGWWAFYSAWFLRGCPGRRAVVLEPDPAHRAVGERTMSLNGLQAEFVAGYVDAEPKALAPFATEDSGEIILPGLSVPQLMAERDIGMLEVLHCDTQGAELAVLESCRDLFAQGRINWVFISTHAHQITGDPLTHQRCLALLRECGAIVEAEHDVQESFSGDGLIVARFGPSPADWHPVKLSFNRYSESLFRNPAYDLARELRKGPSRDAIEKMVQASYKALLLRDADPPGLKHHSDLVEGTGDFDALLNRILRGKGFRNGRDAFSQRYFNHREIAAAKYFATDGPLVCSGLNFTLGRDGPLGKYGESLNVPLDSVMLPTVFTRGAWAANAIEFIVERLEPDEVYALVDIGANIGLFSRQILNASVQVHGVYCVEPDAGNFAALAANLAAYRDRNPRLFNFALGLSDGAATFYRDKENFGNYSLNRDAMRDRSFETVSVSVAATRRWMDETLPREGNLIWKSDTQGHDELIVGHAPWEVWNRVRVAIIELWRIEKPDLNRGDFLDKVESFPNRRLGANLSASTQDVDAYLSSTDWAHADLFLWR
jgi:FkbM family methyltransferase